MLERADSLAREHVDPRSSLACRSDWAAGSRSPHPAEFARGLPMTEPGGRWAALRSTMRFADLRPTPAGRPWAGVSQVLDNWRLQLVRAHDTCHGRSLTSSFLLFSLFSDALGLPQEAYLDFPRSREREAAVARYCALFTAFEIRSQHSLLRLANWRLYTLGLTCRNTLQASTTCGRNAWSDVPSRFKTRWR